MFKSIGFIGLGTMGGRMVQHLKGVGDLIVYDADPTLAAKVAAEVQGRAVSDISGMADADVVVLMLPTSAIVDEVLYGTKGANGLFASLSRGAMVIDMSSSVPTNSVANDEAAAKLGISFIDAPVSGGMRGAEAASLAIMVGGSQAEYDRAAPLLQKMGSNLFHVGKVGAGHAVKALNNLLAATAFAATGEIFAVGAKFGLDPATMLNVINVSSGQNFQTLNVWERVVLSRTFAAGFAMALMEKDVRVAMSLFDAMEADAPLSRASAAVWANALATAKPGSDMTAFAKQAEEAVGL